jgi:hypothetical protein
MGMKTGPRDQRGKGGLGVFFAGQKPPPRLNIQLGVH